MRKQFLFIAVVAAFLATPMIAAAHQWWGGPSYKASGAGGIPAIESTAPNAITPAQAKRAEAKKDSVNKAESVTGIADAVNGNG
jgi:hypothetical protein